MGYVEDNAVMVWVASLLVFGLVGGGLFAMAVVRRRLRDEESEVRELPPDMLIALGRAHDADLARRTGDETRKPG